MEEFHVSPVEGRFMHIVVSHHHSENDFCGFEMALSVFYMTQCM